MNKNLRPVILLTAASLLCPFFAACSESAPSATEAPSESVAVTTDAPDDGTVTYGDLKFTLNGGAKLENGVLTGTKGADTNTAYCEDVGTSAICLDFKIKLTGTTSGAIYFKYRDAEHTYALKFDKKSQRIRLISYDGNDVSTVKSVYHPLEANKEIDIRIAFKNTLLKIFIDDYSETAMADFDIPMELYRNKGLLFDCGTGTLQLVSLNVSEYTYSLSASEQYRNPLAEGADPYILRHNGKYYMYSTNAPMEGYIVYESSNLVDWKNMGYCLKKADVYGNPTSSAGFWAPEVYYLDGRFYMFYTVEENIGVAVADSPLGPFKKYSDGFLFPGQRVIDANLFIDDDGKMYLYYVICKNGNEIYGAEFDFKTLTVSNQHLIITPTANTWEWTGDAGKVAEGPCMLKHNGKYYLSYSCNGYTSHNYAVGYAVSDNPLTGFERYSGNPILAKMPAADVYGPGHHTFMTTEAGELFIVYHKHNSETVIHSRLICIDRCAFEPQENGPDILKVYGPTSTPQKLPE